MTKVGLKIHKESIHDGVFYSCDKCTYKTITIPNLKQHKASSHEGVRYPCDQCDILPFTAVGSLRRHKVSVHKEAQNSIY